MKALIDQELRALLESALAQACQQILSSDDDRWLGAELVDDRIKLSIRSDGLDLAAKGKLEAEFRSRLKAADSGLLETVTINFKRLKKTPEFHQGQSPGPRPSTTQAGPFGSRIQRRAIPGVRHIVAVSSGKGGVGKSTVSSNLAVSLAASGKRVGLLDCDLYGPSLPTMFGVEGPLRVSAEQKLLPHERYGVKLVSFGFMAAKDEPIIWRGPLISKALHQLFYDTDWGDLDILLLDLPPGTGDVQLSMIEKLPVAAGIVVTTPQNVAILDALKGLRMFQKLDVPVLGIVENMSYFECGACGHREAIFGDEATAFAKQQETALLGRLPLQASLRQAGDDGEPAALSVDQVKDIFNEITKKLDAFLA